MLSDKGTIMVSIWKSIMIVECQAQGSGMCYQRHIRHNGLFYQFGRLSGPGIDVVTKISIGPPVKTTFLHAGEVVRNQFVPQAISFIYSRPQDVRSWCPVHPNRVTKT